MAKYIDNPLDGSAGLTGIVSVECMGAGHFGVWPNPPDVFPGSIEFTPAPAGGIALHCVVTEDAPLTYGGQRAEVAGNEANLFGASQWNMPLLYTWEMCIPSSWPRNGNPYTVMQIHDTPDAGSGGWPNVELVVKDNRIYAMIPANFYNYGTGTGAAINLMGADVKFDKWVKCALWCKWDKSADNGFIELVYDGKVLDGRYNTRTARADVSPPYSKFGVYDVLHLGGFGKLEAWYRNLALCDGKDGYLSALGYLPNPITSTVMLDR